MDRYPRISHSYKQDVRHSKAVDRAWREDEEALKDRNTHSRYAEPLRNRYRK